MTTFSTTIKPTIATQKSIQPRVKSIAFGNGYKQIYGDGINSMLEMWNLTFILDSTNYSTINTFLETAAGINYFGWTAPTPSATLKYYICPNWSTTGLGANKYQITCTFEEFAGLVGS